MVLPCNPLAQCNLLTQYRGDTLCVRTRAVLDVQAFRTLRKDIKAKTAEAQERAKSKNTTATTKELQGIVHTVTR